MAGASLCTYKMYEQIAMKIDERCAVRVVIDVLMTSAWQESFPKII